MVAAGRSPRRGEGGFTLVELLVVMLVIGILAAISIPLFLNQKTKASDSTAKVLARTAETAAEAYSTDHNGTYKAMTVGELQAIEVTLKEKRAAELLVAEPGAEGGYIVEAKAVTSGNTFKIERTPSAEIVRTCSKEKSGGCPVGGHW